MVNGRAYLLGAAVGLFTAGCVSPAPPHEQLFAQLDEDGNGKLSFVELQAHGVENYQNADANENGYISLSELGRYVADAKLTPPEERPQVAIHEDNEEVATSADPDRTRRAREIYLSGVRMLASSSPQIERAIREFQQALALDPLYYRAHFKLGISYYNQGHYDLEITEYRKCLAINHNYVPAWLNLGHAHLAQDNLERAREAYKQVLDLEPNHSIALYNKALVEFDLRNEEESLRLFRSFLNIDDSGEMGDKARQYIDRIEQRKDG